MYDIQYQATSIRRLVDVVSTHVEVMIYALDIEYMQQNKLHFSAGICIEVLQIYINIDLIYTSVVDMLLVFVKQKLSG